MQKQGTVVRWDATRAFGFIRSPGISADVFFHIRDFQGAAAPSEGLTVVYEEIHVGGKGPRAMAVQPIGPQGVAPSAATPSHRPAYPSAQRERRTRAHPPTPRPAQRGRRPVKRAARSASAFTGLFMGLLLGWLAVLLWGFRSGRIGLWVWGAAVVINLVTFMVYAMDKSAAQKGRWRTKESHLHLLSLAGGWPGAWCAQQWLRHKSSKVSFQAVYWITVLLHSGALLAWVARWIQ